MRKEVNGWVFSSFCSLSILRDPSQAAHKKVQSPLSLSESAVQVCAAHLTEASRFTELLPMGRVVPTQVASGLKDQGRKAGTPTATCRSVSGLDSSPAVPAADSACHSPSFQVTLDPFPLKGQGPGRAALPGVCVHVYVRTSVHMLLCLCTCDWYIHTHMQTCVHMCKQECTCVYMCGCAHPGTCMCDCSCVPCNHVSA